MVTFKDDPFGRRIYFHDITEKSYTSYAFLTRRNFTTSYSYDKASNRAGFTDPESGATAYVYDTLNRLQTLTPPSAFGTGNFGFSYDAISRRTLLTRPNTIKTTYGYDDLSRLLSVTHAKGTTTIDGASYTVDNAGNRSSRTLLPGTTATNYTYDAIYELLTAKVGTTTNESYTYDVVGNRLSSLGVSPYTNNSSNELTSTPTATYTYDYNGNTLTKVVGTNTTSYAWDFENRLTSVTLPGSGGTVSLKHDPLGRRVYKSSTSGTSVFAYDADSLIEETNSTGVSVARYAQGLNIDEPLAMLRGTTSYYSADGLGSVTSLTNSSGANAATYTFDSYGNLTASTGTMTNAFRYTAREFDTETNLYFYRARYMDASTGRFISEDPIRWAGGLNLYRYVKNQPVTLGDPSGEAPLTKDMQCLVCTIYGEARGLNSACQYGVASVILNRLAQQRAKGRTSSICSIVSAPNQFDAYGGDNYTNCVNCTISPVDRKDFDGTLNNFSHAFDMLSDALYFSNNTPALRKYWEKKKKTGMNFPSCPKLAFYTD